MLAVRSCLMTDWPAVRTVMLFADPDDSRLLPYSVVVESVDQGCGSRVDATWIAYDYTERKRQKYRFLSEEGLVVEDDRGNLLQVLGFIEIPR